MTERRLPLLRGRISSVASYENPAAVVSRAKVPSVDPKAHRSRLFQQLDAIQRQVQSRPEGTRDELASRELIAVRPAPGAELAPEQLDDARTDARLIGIVAETGTVLLDVASPHLDHLRKKIEAFADDSRVQVKTRPDRTTTTHRDKERAIAPIDRIALAAFDDVCGPRLRTEPLVAGRAYWFEMACRGGYRRPLVETESSREQVRRQLHRIDPAQKVDELIGPEQIYFFVRLEREQLTALLALLDCIHEVELAPPPLRDLRLFEDVTTRDLKDFVLSPPGPDAPAVVLLDSGIATGHPLLQPAILSATTAGAEIPSPEDTHGHGTKMAGIALHRDLGAAIERGRADAPHWLQSSRLLVEPGKGTAADENYQSWPALTFRAVHSAEDADPRPRRRVFVLAVTRTMQEPPLDDLAPTLWSHAIDQLARRDGRHGRLLVVSAGNARETQWPALAQQYPQLQLSEKIHQPAQAVNALTVGAFTTRVELPPEEEYREARVVATRPGELSPFTSTGLVGKEWPIKPDIVMEGGNLAISGPLLDPQVPTLCALTTSHRHAAGRPLGHVAMTSEAAARAAHLAARIWALEPKLWPETVRALIVHSATWTPEMAKQFRNVSDRLLAFGHGVPDERAACECAFDRATVVIEDVMPSAVIEEEPKRTRPKRATTRTTELKLRRKMKLYRLPLPERLLGGDDPDVELRVTLSYFAEPNKFGRKVFHGLDLKWDMQGPQESEGQFLRRINKLERPLGSDGKRSKVSTRSFPWDIKTQARSRGTVQSDRWRGKMSELAGDKLIAVLPVLGWWDRRRTLKTEEMRFSLVVSVFGPGVYSVIRPQVEVPVETVIEM